MAAKNPNCYIVQDNINNTYDAIVLLTTINCEYNVNVPRKKLQKNFDANIEDSVYHRAEQVEKLFKKTNFCYNLHAKAIGETNPSMKILEQYRYNLYHHEFH